MRIVRLRYRHDVYCPDYECGRRICERGDISDAHYPAGDPVDVFGFNFTIPRMFDLPCPHGHTANVHFPRDVMLLKAPEPELAKRVAPAILRPWH